MAGGPGRPYSSASTSEMTIAPTISAIHSQPIGLVRRNPNTIVSSTKATTTAMRPIKLPCLVRIVDGLSVRVNELQARDTRIDVRVRDALDLVSPINQDLS